MGRSVGEEASRRPRRESEYLKPTLKTEGEKKSRCVTRKKPPLWSSTMDPECARPDLLETTLRAPFSPRSLEGLSTRGSWSAWATKTAMLVMKLNRKEVFYP